MELKCCSSRPPLRAILTVIGGLMIHMTLSTAYIFGNFMPYVTSYLRKRTSTSDLTYATSIWVSTANQLTICVCMPLLGFIEQRVSTRITALVGSWIFSIGLISSYFTVQQSFLATIMTYGVLSGIGKGMAYPAAVKCAMKWFPNKSGTVSGLIVAGIGCGSFVFNYIITAYINPDNLSPNETILDDRYFTQDSLLDRVPYCFLVLGGTFAGVQLIAVILIGTPQKAVLESDCEVKAISEKSEKDDAHEGLKEQASTLDKDDEKESITPVQVLRTRMFYTLWLIYACVALGIAFVANFFKTYGQTFIHDDHFLALVASFSSVFNALGRIFWGSLSDRFGFQYSMMTLTAIFGCTSLTLVACEYGGKPMFFVWLCLIYGSFSGTFALMASECARVFGPKYYSVNYGMLYTNGIVVNLVGALLSSNLKDKIGWHGIFFIGGGGIICSFLLTLTMRVRCGKRSESVTGSKDKENESAEESVEMNSTNL